MTETQRAIHDSKVQKRIMNEAADKKRAEKQAAKAEKDLAVYLGKQPAKRGVLQSCALNLLKTRVHRAEGTIRQADRDEAVIAGGGRPVRLVAYEPMTEEERGELVAKLALYRSALHDALTAGQKAANAKKASRQAATKAA
jgi:hypothetical protein